MKVKTTIPVLLTAFVLLFSACKKDATHSDLSLNLRHLVEGNEVTLNSIQYTNPAGNNFSVERLVYYISDIRLTDDAGNEYFWDDYQFVDIDDASTHTLLLNQVPVGNYTGMTALIGLNATRNAEGLENTVDNNNMIWPQAMGGGYHFMKLEGRFEASNSDIIGYAMHLGLDANLVTAEAAPFSLTLDEEKESANLNFDIMEWHRNPANWDFEADGTAIMANANSLAKLAANGATVLSISE